MKELFGDKVEVGIFTIDSPEALQYNFRSSTNALFDGEMVSPEIALNKEKMKGFLEKRIGEQ